MAEKKCIHEGHRARLLDTVFKVGLEHLSDIQTAEVLLTYIFPRGDVNPIAHKLIDRFGNIANIIDADINELKAVAGIGDRAAKAIVCLGELYNKVNDCRAQKYCSLSTIEELCDFAEELLRFMTTENLYLIGIDHQCKMIGKKKLTSGSVKNVGITPVSIASFISSAKPAGIIILHNHPNGFCSPSKADVNATEKIVPLIENLGVAYIEHVIVGNDGIFGMKNNIVLRDFNKREF